MAPTTVFDELRDALAQMTFDGTAVGIDLGTTKSCIAVTRFKDGKLACECHTIDQPGWPARCASSLGHADLALKFRAASTAQIEAEEDSALQGALLPERGDDANEMRAAA